MPVLWQSSQRPMYVRTVWVGGFRHAILTHDDPYFLKHKRQRPNSSASYDTTKSKSSRLSIHTDDLQDCLRKLNLVITSGKSRINHRPRPVTAHEDIEILNLTDLDQESENDLVVIANPQPLNETSRSSADSLAFNMRSLRTNKTTKIDDRENTELSERVLQWLDLAGKIDLLAPDNVERMSQPRHSWPELQRRHNLTKSKTAIDIRKEGRTTPKGDNTKAQQNSFIDRHDFYVPTSANTIENYARQSRNAKITPRHETSAKIKDNLNKTKPRDLRTNVVETRQKVITEKNAVEKQYADMLSKKLIPDISKNPKRQVHIFMPELPKKLENSTTTSRAESLLSIPSRKLLNNKI